MTPTPTDTPPEAAALDLEQAIVGVERERQRCERLAAEYTVKAERHNAMSPGQSKADNLARAKSKRLLAERLGAVLRAARQHAEPQETYAQGYQAGYQAAREAAHDFPNSDQG